MQRVPAQTRTCWEGEAGFAIFLYGPIGWGAVRFIRPNQLLIHFILGPLPSPFFRFEVYGFLRREGRGVGVLRCYRFRKLVCRKSIRNFVFVAVGVIVTFGNRADP